MNKTPILTCEYCNQMGNPADYRRLHSHSEDEISLVIQGDIKYISDNITDRIIGRSIIFSKAYQLHNPYIEQCRPYERYQISFQHSQLNDELLKLGDVDSFILPVNDSDFCELLGYMQTMYADFNRRDITPVMITKQKYLLNCLYAKIVHMYTESKHKPNSITKSYIASVMEYISNNCTEKLIIEDIASEFFVSRTKLIKDFSSRTGMTILQYINLSRIKRAKEYLKKGCSVTETANLCGFANSGHFIKIFSELNGITPLKYRQKL